MIEKLARVLANEAEVDWEAMPLLHKLVFRSSARACLEALREPTNPMLDAALKAFVDAPCDENATTFGDAFAPAFLPIWQAMIDVALERKAA